MSYCKNSHLMLVDPNLSVKKKKANLYMKAVILESKPSIKVRYI